MQHHLLLVFCCCVVIALNPKIVAAIDTAVRKATFTSHELVKREVEQLGNLLLEKQAETAPSQPRSLSSSVSALMDMLGGRFIRTYFNEFVLPGTRWCGRGNQASSPIELGEYTRSDWCCRAHDHCRYVIVAGATKWQLKNTDSYTISHCNCDKMFHNCLTAKRFDAASCLIWDTYFAMMKAPCFEFERSNPSNKTNKAVIKRRTYVAPDCSVPNVFKDLVRQVLSRLQGNWRRPGQWKDSAEDDNFLEDYEALMLQW